MGADPESAGPSSRARLTGRAAILIFVVAVLAVSYASSMRAWINQRTEISTLDAQIDEQRRSIAELTDERQRWQDRAFMEIQARQRFGWLMPGETGYRVIDQDGEVLSSGPAALSAPADSDGAAADEWWETSWNSIVEAGKTPEDIAADIKAQLPDREPPTRIVPDQRATEDR